VTSAGDVAVATRAPICFGCVYFFDSGDYSFWPPNHQRDSIDQRLYARVPSLFRLSAALARLKTLTTSLPVVIAIEICFPRQGGAAAHAVRNANSKSNGYLNR
jgi:hypothetical protein